MAKKATHSGECQICGRHQKLPGGCLSKHGYTKEWGFFQGVCPGADNLPFEQSKDMIEPIVEQREAQLVAVREESESLKAGELNDGNVAWVHHYFRGKGFGVSGYYQWIETEIFAEFVPYSDGLPEGNSRGYFRFTYKVGDQIEKPNLDLRIDDLEGARKWLNCQYAEHNLDRTASQLASYIAWQRGRLANWTPKALTQIEEKATA